MKKRLGKIGGFIRPVECECGYSGEYLYIPRRPMERMSQNGKQIEHKINPAKIILDENRCPGCGEDLAKKISGKESGARVLK